MLAKIKNASVQWLISVIFIVNGFDCTTRCPSSIVKHLDLSGPGRRWSNWPRSIYSPLIIFCFKASGTLPSKAWNTLSVDVTDTEPAPKWTATLPAAVDIVVSDEPDDAVVVADAPDVSESDVLGINALRCKPWSCSAACSATLQSCSSLRDKVKR